MATVTDARASLREALTALERLSGQLDALDLPHGAETAAPKPSAGKLAWGAHVSQTFRERIRWSCEDPQQGLGFDPNYLMACIAWETGERFSPDVKNMAGSGATGLIQFMPATAIGLGTTTAALAAMTAEDQIKYVYRYFLPFKGRLRTLSDVYMAILLPSAVGKPEEHALFSGGVAYRQNSGLDANRDGKVTKGEASAKVLAKLQKGLQPEHMG